MANGSFTAVVHDANIRGVEPYVSTKGNKSLIVRFEDEAGRNSTVIDKDLERQPFYKKDTHMDLYLNIVCGKYTSITVKDVVIIPKVDATTGEVVN